MTDKTRHLSKTTGAPPRAWQRMLSGRRLDLLAPSPSDIEIEDIAHGLARVARWNGQTLGTHALSVAQHVVIVEEIFFDIEPESPRSWRLAALLHDAPEYVVGDLISPFKTAIGLDYKALELKLLAAIHARFGLPSELPEDVNVAIKCADRIAAYYEATTLAGFDIDEAHRFFGEPSGLSEALRMRLETLTAEPVAVAQDCFLRRFRELNTSSNNR
jgi:5'-deoxynucleotidase YfbR-like HD superfamily hydrolase